MNMIAALTIAALRQHGTEALPGYEEQLAAACAAYPPPFGMAWYGKHFRELASNPAWLANSLVANAEKEADGSRSLWAMVSRIGDAAVAAQVRQHALDEARHARYYLSLLTLAFPRGVDKAVLSQLEESFPGYTSKDVPPPADKRSDPALILDELVQMNIGEIRTRIHQLLLQPVIAAYCPTGNRTRLGRLMDTLLRDETCHITYTARLLDGAVAAGHGELVRDLMHSRVAQFNELTLQQIGAGALTNS